MMRELWIWVLPLYVALCSACLDDARSIRTETPSEDTRAYAAALSGSAGMAQPAGGAGGTGRAFCIHPPECVPVYTLAFGFDTCCPQNGETCGYEVVYPENLADGTCRPNSQVFTKAAGQEERRISTEGAPDQLITPGCETRTLLAFPLPGCCMPDDRCGVSTYQVADILLGLSLLPAPFTRPECVPADVLNAQFRASFLAGMGQIPATVGSCSYAELNARLPHDPPM